MFAKVLCEFKPPEANIRVLFCVFNAFSMLHHHILLDKLFFR